MNVVVTELVAQAQVLSPVQRAELIESLIESMQHSDKEIEALWAFEAEERIDAIARGEMLIEGEPRILSEFRARRQ